MAEAEVSVKIVADIEDMKKSLAEMSAKMGDVEKVGGVGLDNMFGKASVLSIGFNAVTTAVGFLSEKLKAVTLDLALVGERAAQVEAGFVRLADNAGLAGESLKQSIVDAAQGTIETTELLRRSSELVVAFGQDAQRIPELIELSRKAARAFGIDSADAFDRLSEAVRNGSDRALKQLGITIDLDKAKRDYAASIGVAVNELTKEGEATARLNALLDTAGKKFGDIDLRQKTVGEGVAKITNAIGDLTEAIGKIVSGTGLPEWLDSVAGGIQHVSEMITARFGSGIESVRAKIPELNGEIANLRAEIILLEKDGLGLWDRLFNSDVIEEKKRKLAELEKQLAQLGTGEVMGPPTAAQAGAGSAEAEADKTNKEKRLENERKFQEEINRIRLQQAQNDIKLAMDKDLLEAAQLERQMAMEQELELKKQEIRNNELLTKQQQNQMIAEQEQLHQQNLLMLRQQEEAEYNAYLQRKLENTSAVDEQIALSAEIKSRQTTAAWQRAGGIGGAMVTSFGNRSVAAFQAMGAGAMTASEAVKGAMFGMIADVAAQYGKMMMLSSIFPPNPLAFAAGAALVALSGALGAKAGGGAQMGGGGDFGGGGGFGGGGFGGPSIAEAQERRKDVTINIEGNYYDNEQTRLAIVQAVRDAGDSSDFTVQRGNRRR